MVGYPLATPRRNVKGLPVDPMVAFEAAEDEIWAERAGRVEGAAGEIDAGEFGDEEGEADPYG